MSDQSSQEPTMEEILASIRRIISEDDAPAEPEAAAPAPAPVPEPEPEPEYQAPVEDDVLELTDPIAPEPAYVPEPEPLESVGDLDVYSPAAPEPAPAPPPAPYAPSTPAFNRDDVAENLVGDHASGLAASAFGSLSAAMLMPRDGRTLEDVVRELLKPLLKSWLDEHLPRIVEAKVEEEVHRIARGRGV